MSGTPLFPPYLNQGSKGAAVNVLGLILQVLELDSTDDDDDESHPIILDGEYTPDGAIAAAVKNFQGLAGFTGEDVDGNFGPATRVRFRERYGIDVDALTVEMFADPTVDTVGAELTVSPTLLAP